MTEPRGAIYLIERAPIDITYSHTIDFKSPEEQLAFWGSLVKTELREYQYIRRERRFIQIDKSYESLDGINYLYFRSRENSKYYFAFVTEREYISDNVTRVFFEIDVLQSFMFDYKFKPSYIAQAHVDRWNADHSPKYSRTDEGLAYGSEYVTEAAYKMKPDAPTGHGFYLVYTTSIPADSGIEYSSDVDLSKSSTISGNPTPYNIFIIPEAAESEKVIGIAYNSMTTNSLANMHELQRFMMSSGLGEYIKQIVYVPYLPFKYSFKAATGNASGIDYEVDFDIEYVPMYFKEGNNAIRCVFIKRIPADSIIKDYASLGLFDGLEEKIPTSAEWNAIKANPYTTERDRRFESKLLTFPYRYNIFTDWIGAPALIKNEYLFADKINIKGSIGFGFNCPRRYWIEDYRADPEGREASISQLIPLEQPIISDAYYSYLLQNKNQISANLTNAKINAITTTIGGAGAGAIAGAHGAGVAGAIGGAIFGTAKAGLDSALNIQAMIRSENAKQSDIKNIPDTIANSNDCTLAIADECRYLTFYRKAISCEFEEQLAQYWAMYGYIVKRVEIPDLRSRVRYNFIKTIGANIEGEIESSYLAAIKTIYDNGLTIWHYSEKDFHPLDYSYENIERKLI